MAKTPTLCTTCGQQKTAVLDCLNCPSDFVVLYPPVTDVTTDNFTFVLVETIITGAGCNQPIASSRGVTASLDVLRAALKETFLIVASDETTPLTVGLAKVTFRIPYDFILTDIRASVTTAPTDADLIIDVNESGVSILSTLLTIDATEKTSTTAVVPVVILDNNLADDAEITIDIDQIGSTIAGAGLKVSLIGHQ